MSQIIKYSLSDHHQIGFISADLNTWYDLLVKLNEKPSYLTLAKPIQVERYIANCDPDTIDYLRKISNAYNINTRAIIKLTKITLNVQEYFEYQRRFDKQEFLREIVRDLREANYDK